MRERGKRRDNSYNHSYNSSRGGVAGERRLRRLLGMMGWRRSRRRMTMTMMMKWGTGRKKRRRRLRVVFVRSRSIQVRRLGFERGEGVLLVVGRGWGVVMVSFAFFYDEPILYWIE
jgi:hypothetical protein